MLSDKPTEYEGIRTSESQQVLEWMAMGEINGGIKVLLLVLAARFPPAVPGDLEAAIRASANLEQLRSWLVSAIKADSLDAFRQAAGL